jgi:glycosyltransferase involved in cell wall biosynthesis
VVIPAYNAASSLDETLESVRKQTHSNLEILVIDDGSEDRTLAIARAHAARDARVAILQQANRGVGAARNAGVRAARGRYIAPIDADDLWRADKIARQVEAISQAGPSVGLVYTWFALIDEQSNIISTRSRPSDEGDVLKRMCVGNLTGNASSALMPRDVVLAVGGYDESLHQRGIPGCEDLKLYWLIAERYRFVCVQDYLTGYRLRGDSMSNNLPRMMASFEAVTGPLLERRPDLAAQFHRGRNEILRWLTIRALRAAAWDRAAEFLIANWKHDRSATLAFLPRLPAHFARLALNLSWRSLKPGGAFLS